MSSSAIKRVTAADVARSLGLSRATVGFVLNDTPGQTIPDATRQRVFAEAKRLGYRPHGAARALASGHSRIILLVLPDWPLDYSMRAHLDEAALALDRAGYALVTMTPHPGGQAQPLWETLRPDVVMGMTPLAPEQVAEIRASGVEHVIVPGQSDEPVESAGQLGFADGPKLQVEHLVLRGRTRIAFAGPADPRLSDLVADRRGLAHATALLYPDVSWLGERLIDDLSASAAIEEWLSQDVDGIVAYNDDVAALVVGTALRAGIDVPEALAVVGHDDTPLARLFVPALSTVRIDTAGLGRYLAELALSVATGAPEPSAGPETAAHLIQRETT